MDQTKQAERDYVAEAEQAAYDWVKYAAGRVVRAWLFQLDQWDEAHNRPDAPGIHGRYGELRALNRAAVYDVAYRAAHFSFWDVLEQYGYGREVFGAEERPKYRPPKRLESEWWRVIRHERRDLSLRFRGVHTSVNHKRKKYLSVTPHVEMKTETTIVVDLPDKGRYTIRLDLVLADGVAATAGDVFEQAKRRGLLRGILQFGLLTKDLKNPVILPHDQVFPKEAATATSPGRTNARKGNRQAGGTRVTLKDGTVIEMSPGASVTIGDNTRVEALVASA